MLPTNYQPTTNQLLIFVYASTQVTPSPRFVVLHAQA